MTGFSYAQSDNVIIDQYQPSPSDQYQQSPQAEPQVQNLALQINQPAKEQVVSQGQVIFAFNVKSYGEANLELDCHINIIKTDTSSEDTVAQNYKIVDVRTDEQGNGKTNLELESGSYNYFIDCGSNDIAQKSETVSFRVDEYDVSTTTNQPTTPNNPTTQNSGGHRSSSSDNDLMYFIARLF